MLLSCIRLWVVGLLCALTAQAANSAPSMNDKQSVAVNNVRVWHGAQYTRLVLDLNGPVQHSLVFVENPTRVLLDIPGTALDTKLEAALAALTLTGTPVDVIHASVINQKDLHLILALNKKVTPKSFFLKKQGSSDDRLVLDLYEVAEPIGVADAVHPAAPLSASTLNASGGGNSPANELKEPANLEDLIAASTTEAKLNELKTIAAKNNEAKANETKTNETKTNETKANEAKANEAKANEARITEARIKEIKASETKTIESKINVDLGGKRTILIAVDAGHGGEDTGALGPNNMREKDVTLAIAKELVEVINAQPGFSAHLTRSSDFFIPLQKRRNIARDMKADLFVSIHADAFTNSSAKGASVFALSRRGATSETARFLAQRENESDLFGGVGGVSLDDKDVVLAGVLVDLSMTATVNSSLQVGDSVLNSIATIAPLHARHVEQAGFMVLKSPDVPSILVETGFISNNEESRQLASPAYRAQMAQAVFKGLHQYFLQNPPAGTYVAAVQFGDKSEPVPRRHKVARGETLTLIASHYNVSLNQLLEYNDLSTRTIKVGQTIKIPES